MQWLCASIYVYYIYGASYGTRMAECHGMEFNLTV